jgi:hypothetical protein
MFLKILIGITAFSTGYLLVLLTFDVLLRGFAPFIPSRPWVIDKILNNLKLKHYQRLYAFGAGRSGFLYEFQNLFPETEIVGIEYMRFPYLVAKTQLFLRRILMLKTNIRVIYSKIRDVDISGAEIIYSHLYPEHMEGLGQKLKFECQPGTIIISNGFIIPGLETNKMVTLDERKGRFAWLSKNRELFKSRRKKSVKENKVYFYEI